VHPKTQVPVVAIALQGIVAVIIALSGTYEQILSYVVSVGFIFFGLTGSALFVFRRRQASEGFRTPGHPVTTAIFVAACFAIVIATFVRAPRDSAIGVAMVIAGLPAYLFWRRRDENQRRSAAATSSGSRAS
jgi:APA family basic amino acid/polyamine antiporter